MCDQFSKNTETDDIVSRNCSQSQPENKIEIIKWVKRTLFNRTRQNRMPLFKGNPQSGLSIKMSIVLCIVRLHNVLVNLLYKGFFPLLLP